MESKRKDTIVLLENAHQKSNEYEEKLKGKKLDIVYASELPDKFTAADELIEGLLICGDSSVAFGDTNTGKTFFVISAGAAVSLGIDFFGRKTEKGVVVYLAAESPSSVMRRLQTYQKYYNVKLDDFIIVKNPINLYSSDADANAIVALIKEVEETTGKKVRLIIGDTLARLIAGANENSGEHMGVVIQHVDYVRTQCNAHFMLIHHTGKNLAAGARGWSGTRGAIDTEIEITESADGKCAEITKQRDLDSKGERIGFRLERIVMGVTKWGKEATSCVALPADAPVKKVSKKLGEVEGSIMEYFHQLKLTGIHHVLKRDCVTHFENRKSPQSVYNSIKRLVDAGELILDHGHLRLGE